MSGLGSVWIETRDLEGWLGLEMQYHLLPDASIDLAIMVDVYHEFSHPYEMAIPEGVTVEPTARGFRLTLEEPAYGVASGQAAVLYDGDATLPDEVQLLWYKAIDTDRR